MFCPPPPSPSSATPCLRPPGFRKWSIIFLFRRHEPAPLQLLHALQLRVYRHFSTHHLILPTPKLSYVTFHKYPSSSPSFFSPFSLPGFGYINLSCCFFFLSYMLSVHFLLLMTPNWCVSRVWKQVKCVARWLQSYKNHILPHCL